MHCLVHQGVVKRPRECDHSNENRGYNRSGPDQQREAAELQYGNHSNADEQAAVDDRSAQTLCPLALFVSAPCGNRYLVDLTRKSNSPGALRLRNIFTTYRSTATSY